MKRELKISSTNCTQFIVKRRTILDIENINVLMVTQYFSSHNAKVNVLVTLYHSPNSMLDVQ